MRTYASISFSVAAGSALFSILPSSESRIVAKKCDKSCSDIDVVPDDLSKLTEINVLSVKTLCSLIISDLPYLIFAVLVNEFPANYFEFRGLSVLHISIFEYLLFSVT